MENFLQKINNSKAKQGSAASQRVSLTPSGNTPALVD